MAKTATAKRSSAKAGSVKRKEPQSISAEIAEIQKAAEATTAEFVRMDAQLKETGVLIKELFPVEPVALAEVDQRKVQEDRWTSDFNSDTGCAPCPRCLAKRTAVRTTRGIENGCRVRYHACVVCKARFKSVEELS